MTWARISLLLCPPLSPDPLILEVSETPLISCGKAGGPRRWEAKESASPKPLPPPPSGPFARPSLKPSSLGSGEAKTWKGAQSFGYTGVIRLITEPKLSGGIQWAKDFLIFLVKSENDQKRLALNCIQRTGNTSPKERACRGSEEKGIKLFSVTFPGSWILNKMVTFIH